MKLHAITAMTALLFAGQASAQAPEGTNDDSIFPYLHTEIYNHITGTGDGDKYTGFRKVFLYDQHTLEDEYLYGETERRFQWDKIGEYLAYVDRLNGSKANWGVLENYKNEHGQAPVLDEEDADNAARTTDKFGVDRNQSIPLYTQDDMAEPSRYGRDGSLVKIINTDEDYITTENVNFSGDWLAPDQYVRALDTDVFNKVIFVDATNQNICTMENVDGEWLVRSMNPATTGAHNPPYQRETPNGIFVVQDKKEKMWYLRDGTSDIAGYAPYASRFTNGAYVHGVPLNGANASLIEFSKTLGTIPRSHMCVRNATSHAKYVYDWAPVDQALVIVFE